MSLVDLSADDAGAAGPSGSPRANGTGPSGSNGAGPSGSDGAGPSGSDGAGPSGSNGAGPSGSNGAGPSGSNGAGISGSSGAGPSGSGRADGASGSGAGAGAAAAIDPQAVQHLSAVPAEVGEALSAALRKEEMDRRAIDSQLQAEASAIGSCQWVANKLNKLLSNPGAGPWAPPGLKQARLAELSAVASKLVLPTFSVVVVGVTGAGKSTLLNSVLGETSVLPTNGMRACTAALIELRYNDRDPQEQQDYYAEIEFISQEEWYAELDGLLEDLQQQDGRAVLNVQPGGHNYVSWCKVFAVYGEAYTHSRVAVRTAAARPRFPPPPGAALCPSRRLYPPC